VLDHPGNLVQSMVLSSLDFDVIQVAVVGEVLQDFSFFGSIWLWMVSPGL